MNSSHKQHSQKRAYRKGKDTKTNKRIECCLFESLEQSRLFIPDQTSYKSSGMSTLLGPSQVEKVL